MKKILIAISLLTLTGCGQKLICTNNTETETLKIEEKLIITHQINKVTNVETDVTYTIKDENIKESFKKTFETIKENYNKENINYKEEIKDNIYKFNVKYSPEKLDEETLNNFRSAKKFKKYKEKILEQGMKCE